LQADNGNATAILSATDYVRKISHLLEDPSYRRLAKDYTRCMEQRTTLPFKKSSISDDTTEQLRLHGSRSYTLYRLPKIHKAGVQLRPIISTIRTPTHRLDKYLHGLLWACLRKTAPHVKNSEDFILRLGILWVNPNDILISFEDHVTKVPIINVLNLLNRLFDEDNVRLFTTSSFLRLSLSTVSSTSN